MLWLYLTQVAEKMDININHIKVAKTARYASYGVLSPKTKYFWFCLHGSKMVCEQIIKKFKDFDPQEHVVLAPEGLSRFYSEGFGGPVVATWMTSRDRLAEIADFSDYLTQLYNSYTEQLAAGCHKIVLGFSQGGTTAYRWLHHSEITLDALIGYSCWVPEDIDLKVSRTTLSEVDKIYTFGHQDQFLSKERIKMLESVIAKNDMTIDFESYEGDHRIDRDQLQFLFEKYIKRGG